MIAGPAGGTVRNKGGPAADAKQESGVKTLLTSQAGGYKLPLVPYIPRKV